MIGSDAGSPNAWSGKALMASPWEPVSQAGKRAPFRLGASAAANDCRDMAQHFPAWETAPSRSTPFRELFSRPHQGRFPRLGNRIEVPQFKPYPAQSGSVTCAAPGRSSAVTDDPAPLSVRTRIRCLNRPLTACQATARAKSSRLHGKDGSSMQGLPRALRRSANLDCTKTSLCLDANTVLVGDRRTFGHLPVGCVQRRRRTLVSSRTIWRTSGRVYSEVVRRSACPMACMSTVG